MEGRNGRTEHIRRKRKKGRNVMKKCKEESGEDRVERSGKAKDEK
jgi:hypothetical protein